MIKYVVQNLFFLTSCDKEITLINLFFITRERKIVVELWLTNCYVVDTQNDIFFNTKEHVFGKLYFKYIFLIYFKYFFRNSF